MFRLVSTVRAPRIGAQNADQIKIADFNGDRRPDIFGIDNGIDKMPFTGGQNKLFLSSAGQLVDATGNLPQAMLNNHGASAGDIDNDGGLDLLVNALMFDGNFLYLNNGLGVRPVESSPTGC